MIGQVLRLKREPDNCNKYAVAIVFRRLCSRSRPVQSGQVSVSVPIKGCYITKVRVTGSKVNRKAGYGLEIPVVYCLY